MTNRLSVNHSHDPVKQWEPKSGYWVLRCENHVAVITDPFSGSSTANPAILGVRHFGYFDDQPVCHGKTVQAVKRRLQKLMRKKLMDGKTQRAAVKAAQIAGGMPTPEEPLMPRGRK
jgi:hypothetical protein